jgi:ubiquitin-conjugating enzyme E2 O
LGFKRNGASLGNFVEPSVQPVEMKTRSFRGKAVIQSKKSGFARTVFLKLKRVLGLKKMNKSGKSGVKEKGF